MDHSYIQNFIKAGALAAEARAYGMSLLKPGASCLEIIRKIQEKIQSLGAKPAFPPQLSLNEVAAHFFPTEDILLGPDLVKLDVGVCYQGAIGDCAETLDLSGRHQLLVDATKQALQKAEDILEVGLPVSSIGKILSETLLAKGFQPIRNLSGHGLGPYQIHTDPIIPNYDDKSPVRLRKEMSFAIEPFGTTGSGWVVATHTPTLFSARKHKLIAKPSMEKILLAIARFQGLPFSLHDIAKETLSLQTAQIALQKLTALGILDSYPALIEKTNGMVAQAENSILIDKQGKVHITTR